MTIHLGVPLAATVVGALVYLLAPGKWSEMGKIAFGCGLLAFLLSVK